MAYEVRFGHVVRTTGAIKPGRQLVIQSARSYGKSTLAKMWADAREQIRAELKGKRDGNCNRTDCQRPGAIWFNSSTRAYYCEDCATDINDFAMRSERVTLLTVDPELGLREAMNALRLRIDWFGSEDDHYLSLSIPRIAKRFGIEEQVLRDAWASDRANGSL